MHVYATGASNGTNDSSDTGIQCVIANCQLVLSVFAQRSLCYRKGFISVTGLCSYFSHLFSILHALNWRLNMLFTEPVHLHSADIALYSAL